MTGVKDASFSFGADANDDLCTNLIDNLPDYGVLLTKQAESGTLTLACGV